MQYHIILKYDGKYIRTICAFNNKREAEDYKYNYEDEFAGTMHIIDVWAIEEVK